MQISPIPLDLAYTESSIFLCYGIYMYNYKANEIICLESASQMLGLSEVYSLEWRHHMLLLQLSNITLKHFFAKYTLPSPLNVI